MKVELTSEEIAALEDALDWICRHQPMTWDDGTRKCVCYQNGACIAVATDKTNNFVEHCPAKAWNAVKKLKKENKNGND